MTREQLAQEFKSYAALDMLPDKFENSGQMSFRLASPWQEQHDAKSAGSDVQLGMQFDDILLMTPKTIWKLQTMKLKDWLLAQYRSNDEGTFEESNSLITEQCGKLQQKFEGIEADIRKLQATQMNQNMS